MTQKLSAFKFIRNNKRQVFVMILALGLTFMAMYILNFILGVTEESFKPFLLDRPGKITFAKLTDQTLGAEWDDTMTEEQYNELYLEKMDDLMKELKKQDDIKECYYIPICGGQYLAVVGSWWYEFPLLEVARIPDYLNDMDAKLVEGRLPERDGEILLDQKIMLNRHFQIGDIYEEGIWGKTFTIVGVLKSDTMTCVGIPRGGTNAGWYLVIVHDKSASDFKEVMSRLGRDISEKDEIIDAVQCKKDYEKDVVGVIDASISVILLVVVIFLAIAVFVTYISFMRNRVNEWCLYASIGYSRKDVYGLIMRETLTIFGSSIVFGCIAGVILLVILAKCLIEPMGLSYAFWYPQYFIRLLAIYVFLIGVLQIPILIIIHRIRTIDLVEER